MKNLQKTLWFPPVVIFVAVMAVAIGSFFMSRESIANERKKAIESYALQTEDILGDRVLLVEEALYSGAGLFAGADEVDKKIWKEYVEASTVLKRYDGVQGIGYSKVIEPEELAQFELEAKSSVTNDFEVFPSGERDLYTSILYIEPLDERNKRAIGFDMFSEASRRKSMERARDSGKASATSAVRLVQENGIDEQKGFLLYVPQYDENAPVETTQERRQAIEGYVYAIFRAETFIDNSFPSDEIKTESNAAAFRVFSGDVEDKNLIYTTENYEEITSSEHTVITREVITEGAEWTFEYSYLPNKLLGQAFSERPMTILFFGIFAAFLIAAVTYLLLRGKSNELELAQERETNDAKDSLLSIASHQLRTPATGVKQYLGMVMQGFVGDISSPQRSMLEKAYESNERQLKTINDILFLARLDSGRMVLSRNKINVNELVKSVVEEQQDEIVSAEHKVSVSVPKKTVTVEADEHMLRMCVENLLSNAIKYTRSGGKIRIKVKQSNENTTISVSDNGVGIASDDVDKLFKQFSRIQNELSKSVSGTGIGLYLVRFIVELHNGTVEVDSSSENGSTFTIKLPRNQ